MKAVIFRCDTKFCKKVIPLLWDPHNSNFYLISYFTIFMYIKFGDNQTEIMTFKIFIKF